MTFEVAPTTVRAGHWRAAIALVAALAVAVVAVAVISKPAATVRARTATVDAATIAAQRLPVTLDCHDLGRPACELATHTALSLISTDDGHVTAAGAWKSLLCSTTIDCPPSRLTADATPVGSVILSFATGPAAWINVMSRPEPTDAGTRPAPYAWVIRWR